jgi:hypothetical protein
MGPEAAAFGKALAPLNEGPETAVGKTVVRFCGVEILGELALGNVSNGSLVQTARVGGPDMAMIPGAAEQGRELAFRSRRGVKYGGEFFREREQPAIGGGLPIAQIVEQASGGQPSGCDASVDPRLVNFREQATDLIPTGPFARLTGFAYQDNEEIEAMTGGIHHAVGSGTHDIAKSGEQLKKDCGRMRLGVRGKGTNSLAGEAVEGGFVQFGMRDGFG